MQEHLMYCAEQKFNTGTWGGAVLTGFTVVCCQCSGCFCVTEGVITRGSLFTVRSVCDLTCPYCGHKAPTKPDQERILADTSYRGED